MRLCRANKSRENAAMHTSSRIGDLAPLSFHSAQIHPLREDQPTGAASPMQEITIDREPVELYKILKFEGLVGSGGEAKAAIANGLVKLNGSVETRKRKKVSGDDTLQFGEQQFKVVVKHRPD